ncbi:MAG: tRNA dimethylallyltransferase [Candidatus Berkelbacteria bacterium Licking1014_85]|uniref:tRNA dimethylallyltransferase n=1 Tax=Candidatus Berkelbacteria bacterium Licking1014_85 TaxID=2017148 RepID=A0A554LJD2_9BACT|nr:MAG: tRNA dimethylallyltransferase [Candidatus Berkelbacteria bacterium Licking1014_85]
MKKIVAIIGPTASGKSDLARKLIEKFPNLEAISIDSRQIFKRLDLGTGKDKSFFQHLIDIAEPEENFSVVKFRNLALNTVNKIHQHNKIPLLVGGSPYYMDAIVYDINFPEVSVNLELREKLEKMTTSVLYKKLNRLDSARAENIDPRNRKRIIRAIEIVESTGRPVPSLNHKKLRFNTLIIGIDIDRDLLYAKIDKRVNDRIESGMIKEIRDLISSGISKAWLKNLGLEYKLITEYLEAKYTRDEMIQKLKFEIHAFCRRQLTWYRQNKDIIWIDNFTQAKSLVNDFML